MKVQSAGNLIQRRIKRISVSSFRYVWNGSVSYFTSIVLSRRNGRRNFQIRDKLRLWAWQGVGESGIDSWNCLVEKMFANSQGGGFKLATWKFSKDSNILRLWMFMNRIFAFHLGNLFV